MSRARRYIAPMARLTIFVVTCAAVLLYIDFRVAKASVMERLLGIGQRMAPFMDDARGIEPPREVHMNGLRMWVAAGKTDRSPSEVRRWYAERYAGRGTATDVITEGLKAVKALPPSVSGLTQAQFGDDNVGGVAALDLGQGTTLKMIKQSLNKLATGKIGEVGHLRYMYFERTGEGGTRYITIWTDDQFDLTQFLPQGGQDDAPGKDIDDVPRYPGTIRVLSADERGRAAQMAVYNGTGSPETAAMFYQGRMKTMGWAQDPRFTQYASQQGMHSLRFMNAKGHEVVIDLTSDDRRGQGLTVTLLQLH
jgi:hypothetical protein